MRAKYVDVALDVQSAEMVVVASGQRDAVHLQAEVDEFLHPTRSLQVRHLVPDLFVFESTG